MTDHTPLTGAQLDEIDARAGNLFKYVTLPSEADQLAGVDVPALLADLRRARAHIAELEGVKPARCGRTRDISGTEHGPCVLSAGHRNAYCRTAGGGSYFLSVAADQPAEPASDAAGAPLAAEPAPKAHGEHQTPAKPSHGHTAAPEATDAPQTPAHDPDAPDPHTTPQTPPQARTGAPTGTEETNR